jgi:hypothetical protein
MATRAYRILCVPYAIQPVSLEFMDIERDHVQDDGAVYVLDKLSSRLLELMFFHGNRPFAGNNPR